MSWQAKTGLAYAGRVAEQPAVGGASGQVAQVFGTHNEHDEDVFVGCELFFRPGYAANLVPSWIRAVRGCAYSGLGL